MNEQLQEFARSTLKTMLAELPESSHRMFRLMYARDGGKRSVEDALTVPVNDVVDQMPASQLDWAMRQFNNTVRKQRWCSEA